MLAHLKITVMELFIYTCFLNEFENIRKACFAPVANSIGSAVLGGNGLFLPMLIVLLLSYFCLQLFE